MKKEDFKPGQTVYLLPVRFQGFEFDAIQKQIMETTVTAVGRKYITVSRPYGLKFDMTKDFREVTPYSVQYKLFLSKEDIEKDCERREMERWVATGLHSPNHITRKMSYEDLKTVCDIVRKYTKF